MEWMELFKATVPWQRQVSYLLPVLIVLLAIRVAWDIKSQPNSFNRKRVLIISIGIALTALTFSNRSWGWWPFVMVFGWLLAAAAKPQWKSIPKYALNSMAFVLVGGGLLGIGSGRAPALTLGPSMWPTASKGISTHLLNFQAYNHSAVTYGDDVNFEVAIKQPNWPVGRYRKRVWALPGDDVVVENNRVWINKILVADCTDASRAIAVSVWWCKVTWSNGVTRDVAWGLDNKRWIPNQHLTLDNNALFVIGDNTIESSDSRERGPILRSWIDGRFDSEQPAQPQPWKAWASNTPPTVFPVAFQVAR